MDCSNCGKPVPPERLEALPETTVCIVCSSVTPYTEETPGLIDGPDATELYKANGG